jgi:hypothetical protein
MSDYRQRQKSRLDEAFREYGRRDGKGGYGEFRDGELVTISWDKLPDPTIPQNGDTWGSWRLSTRYRTPSLDYGHYEIVLSELFSPEDDYTHAPKFLDWINHLHGKTWGSDPETMGNFIDAVLTIRRYGFMLGKKHLDCCGRGWEKECQGWAA